MVRFWVNESSILGLSRTDFVQWLLDAGSVIPAPSAKIFTNSIGIKFILIAAGPFAMDSRIESAELVRKYGGIIDWHEREHPRHPVNIRQKIFLQTTEVTQAQWKQLMGGNPSTFNQCGGDCPVESVSWYEWVQDRYDHYPNTQVIDPQRPDKGAYRIARGGSWDVAQGWARCAFRFMSGPQHRDKGIGFGCVKSIR